MQRSNTIHSVTFFLLAGAAALGGASARASVAGFEDLSPGAAGYWNGSDGSGGFSSGGLTFNNSFTDWGGGYYSWAGWAYSNKTDTATPGYENQYSAIAGGGQGGSGNYAVGYGGFPAATVTTQENTLFQSAYLTNTTYAYLSMRDGDAFAKKFNATDEDWFKLTITGRNAAQVVVGSIDVYLADFRLAAARFDNPVKDNYILNQWRKVDLAGLGNTARTLSLSFASSDNGDFGMNTPAYAAFDTFTVVPATLPPDVQNSAALNLVGGVRQLGDVTGSGTLTVQPGTTLVADSIVQDTLTIGAGGAVVIRETTAQGASAVPEPGLLALLLGGAAAGLLWRRRRQ
jgi:hypothetical protein